MRKATILLLLSALVLTASSCSYYTCATYAKKPKPEIPAEQRI